MTIDTGAWVKRRKENDRGIVKSKKGHIANVLWMRANKARACSMKSLILCHPPRALVLEGTLDSKLESTRSEENVLRTWLDSQRVTLAYKNIHTLEDISVLARAIGNDKPLFAHISCHGDHDDDQGAYIILAPNSNDPKNHIYLNDKLTIDVFKSAFEGIPILFSACWLGRFKRDMDLFRQNANLGKIAAFTRIVCDSECMLFELLVYQSIFVQGCPFETAVEKAEKALGVVGIRGVKGKGFVRVF